MINPMLEAELLAHLDNQIGSARHLLRVVLAQGEAIRARDTETYRLRSSSITTTRADVSYSMTPTNRIW